MTNTSIALNHDRIEPSDLIVNDDGTVFHLHLHPAQLADRIIMVGDPGRVDMVAAHFESREFEVSSREFHTVGGTYAGKRVMCISHGIGPDNIDIVLTELDVLANVDLTTRMPRSQSRTLTIVRIGTSGALQPELIPGTPVIAEMAVGLDGVLNYYAGRDMVSDIDFEQALCRHCHWNDKWARPYAVFADEELVSRIGSDDMVRGTTLSAVGFYGPQGRRVRLNLANPDINRQLETFEYDGRRITNYEMESAPLQGLSRLLGHRAMTVCSIIANRVAQEVTPNYHTAMEDLVETVLNRI